MKRTLDFASFYIKPEEIIASRYGRILILKKQKGKWQKEFEQ